MTKTKAALLKLPKDDRISWPAGWPEKIGLLRLGANGPFDVYHLDESDAQIIERIAGLTGKTHSAVTVDTLANFNLLMKAQKAVSDDAEIAEAAQDLEMNVDFALSEGVPMPKAPAAGTNIAGKSPGKAAIRDPDRVDNAKIDYLNNDLAAHGSARQNAKPTGSAVNLAPAESGKPGMSGAPSTINSFFDEDLGDPAMRGEGWMDIATARERKLITRGGILNIDGKMIFRVEGELGDGAILSEMPDEKLEVANDGRRLRFPVSLSAPSFILPDGALLIEPAQNEMLIAYLSSDGEFTQLHIGLNPLPLPAGEVTGEEVVGAATPGKGAIVEAADRHAMGRHNRGAALAIIPLVLFFIGLALVFTMDPLDFFHQRDDLVEPAPAAALKSGMFK